MRYRIRHITRYRYSKPVFLEPHTLRLHPRHDGGQTVEHAAIHIDPAPAGSNCAQDEVGNTVTCAWFNDKHEQMTITADSTVVTTRSNPFDFILDASATSLPLTYPPHSLPTLAIYRQRENLPPLPRGEGRGEGGHELPVLKSPPSRSGADPVASFARELLEQTNQQTLAFLNLLTQQLYERIKIVIRDDGDPLPPAKTWLDKCGACRDLAVLFNDACRCVGLAARFVSGYQEGDPDTQRRHLHAWSEVYLPLAGWRGFDPTHGLAVADRHIALAAGPTPVHAAPVSGNFRATGATAELSHHIEIDVG